MEGFDTWEIRLRQLVAEAAAPEELAHDAGGWYELGLDGLE